MAMQTYIVMAMQPDTELIKDVARALVAMNAYVLMATRQGAIIAAFDDSLVERVRASRGVRFVGGVTLQPHGEASRELHRVFSEHMRAQVGRPPAPAPRPIINRNSFEEE